MCAAHFSWKGCVRTAAYGAIAGVMSPVDGYDRAASPGRSRRIRPPKRSRRRARLRFKQAHQ